MQTLILKIEYDGNNYHGWQVQPGQLSIQGKLEEALSIITQKEMKVMGSGRTDTGVHSSGQIAHSLIDEDFTVPEDKIIKALNNYLPEDILIRNAKIFHGEFHSRFDALTREYEYSLTTNKSVFNRHFVYNHKYPFDKKKLFESAEWFTGKKDFTSFSKKNDQKINPICVVDKSEWIEKDDIFIYSVRSNHFLYGMVRILVGTMLDVARGNKSKEEIIDAFENPVRKKLSKSVPANGLNLIKIEYPDKFGMKDF